VGRIRWVVEVVDVVVEVVIDVVIVRESHLLTRTIHEDS
jgi:hypothetical protein